jgi:antitoxin ParD1/3/4
LAQTFSQKVRWDASVCPQYPHGNVSEYCWTLLRAAQEREEEARLEALLVEGFVSGGNDIPLTREFWTDLNAEAKDLAKKHKSR